MTPVPNIAIFASAFYPSLGGVEELVRQLAHAYRKRGANVIIITNRWPRSLPEHECYEGLDVYRLPLRAPEGSLKALMSYHATERAIRKRLLEILQQHQTQVLHIQCVSSNAYYALDASRMLNLPLMITAQGELTMDADQVFQRSKILNEWLREAVEHADYITGCSQKTLNDLRDHLQLSFAGKSAAIYNGANLSDFAAGIPYQHERPYIFALGRMAPQKGFDVLLRAWAKIHDQPAVAPYDLIIAGDGPQLSPLLELADELNIKDRVVFPGRADRTKTVAFFKGSDFFILPSRADEGFPLVGVEAMAAGKAMIATPTGGLPEVVHHEESALIVPKDDVQALADAILQMAQDRVLRDKLANVAQVIAKRFDWPAIAEEYMAVYQRIIEARAQK